MSLMTFLSASGSVMVVTCIGTVYCRYINKYMSYWRLNTLNPITRLLRRGYGMNARSAAPCAKEYAHHALLEGKKWPAN